MKYKLHYHPQVIKVLSVYRQSCPGMAGIDDIYEMSNESGVHQMVWCHSDHGVAVPGSGDLRTSRVSGPYQQQHGVVYFATSTPTPLPHPHTAPYDTSQ